MATTLTITIAVQDDGSAHVHATQDGKTVVDQVCKSADECMEEVQDLMQGGQGAPDGDQDEDDSEGAGAGIPSAQDMWDQEAAKRQQPSPGM